MKITVDLGKCSGIGICEALAPGYYEVDDDGELVLLADDVPVEDADLIRKTVLECPTGAISIVAD